MNSSDSASRSHLASLQAARNLMNTQAAAVTRRQSAPDPDAELHLLTAGQVADVTHIANLSTTVDNDAVSYEPMDPFALLESQVPTAVETGRLQTRLYALQAKLSNTNIDTSSSGRPAPR